MSLTGPQLKQLQSALLSAFPNQSALEQMVFHQLNIRLNQVAGGSNLSDVVFSLIQWAESRGKLQELIAGAQAENPGNPELKAFLQEVGLASVPAKPDPNPRSASPNRDAITSGPVEDETDPDLPKSGPVSLDKPRWNPVKEVAKPDKIRVLFLPADTRDGVRLGLLKEAGEVRENLMTKAKHRERFDFQNREYVTPELFGDALLNVEPHIVHYSGHGDRSGNMQFVGEGDKSHGVSTEAIGSLIAPFGVQCVVLNACYSGKAAKALLQYVPFVVATRTAINDDAAIAFSIGFYQALGNGRDVGFAFNFGLGQIQAQLSGLKQHQIPVLLER